MSTAFAQTLDALERVLEQENNALTTAQFAALEPIKIAKLTAISDLDRFRSGLSMNDEVKVMFETQLTRVRELILRNTGLLQAAMFGARSAQDRLTGITQRDQQIGAYDQSGRRLALHSETGLKKFKV